MRVYMNSRDVTWMIDRQQVCCPPRQVSSQCRVICFLAGMRLKSLLSPHAEAADAVMLMMLMVLMMLMMQIVVEFFDM